MTSEQNEPINDKNPIVLQEEKILEFWNKNNIFEKTLSKESPKGEFTFYDGPPFATGTPHYGHLLAGTMKDMIPRFKTMQGYHVPRKWGWDCHGVPIETLIQKENNLKTKIDIENFGIKNFNKAARASVFKYDTEWKKIVPRMGRWVDMENQYTTMSNSFMESVWWAFSELNKKGLVYEGFKVMQVSPELETPLSNFEVNQGYKDITDISVYAKFELQDEPNTFLLAWTTTPWTLPGNVALAVGDNLDYVKISITEGEFKGEKFILATALQDEVLKDKQFEILENFKGKNLIGKKYKAIFDYYNKDSNLENHSNGWQVYGADFVTTEEGTGIVHIAPAFGDDDLKLGQKNKLPFVQHVKINGQIKEEITDFAGLQAKPKEDPTKTDIEIIKKLAHENKLFAKKKITHSYPHCWRTDAPLLNFAMSSWFVKVTDYNKKMIANNNKINWVPKTIGEKRFGNWLENVKDWSISRSRYWGTVIPVWKSEDGQEIEFVDSFKKLKSLTKSNNKYFLVRHGEGEHNVGRFINSDDTRISNLTDLGIRQSEKIGKDLQDKNITKIYCSPLHRTRETARIIAEAIGFDPKNIIVDDRLKEVQTGVFNGKPIEEYHAIFKNYIDKFEIRSEGGENLDDIKKRVGEFIYEIDKNNQSENVLVVTHEYPLWMLTAVNDGLQNEEAIKLKPKGQDFVLPGSIIEYDFAPISHDDKYVLDLHRPYIDDVFFEKNGKLMKRVADVFDAWFDSGSMPFAVPHYPFSDEINPAGGLLSKSRGFPADFIAEGLDQTRGWFYTLLAVNTALFGVSPFKNVIVNGLVLAEDGKKMSKSLNNFPDPNHVLDKYGADALRYYLMASPLVKSEPLNFLEKGVDEVLKKNINRLSNVLNFYEMFVSTEESKILFIQNKFESDHDLDKWIIARLWELHDSVTRNLNNYELDTATRPVADFIDDLSTWYLRRSRDRFKGDDLEDVKKAKQTTNFVFTELSKIIAPVMPFMAEHIYQVVSGLNYSNSNKSVHLESWSETKKIDSEIIKKMEKVREIVSLGLEARDKVSIKVRQPLNLLKIKTETSYLGAQLVDLIKDEVNVKNVSFVPALLNNQVELDVELSPELLEEGYIRDLIRFIQSERKNKKLVPEDEILLLIETSNELKESIVKYEQEIKKVVNALKINFTANNGQETKISDFNIKIEIK
jgi:isoleucyl-tRNA synthetase